VHVFDHELSLPQEDLRVDTAQVLVLSVEVVGLPAAETVEVAPVSQLDVDLALALGDHVGDAETKAAAGPLDAEHLHEEAAHFD
jgi:hypothetical protein